MIEALAAQGAGIVPEPGRRVVRSELQAGRAALPWVDMAAFAQKAIALAKRDLSETASRTVILYFDRGFIDAAVALQRSEGVPVERTLRDMPEFCEDVLFAPPWLENFQSDRERRSTWQEALDECDVLRQVYTDLGFRLIDLPQVSVADRVDFVFDHFGRP